MSEASSRENTGNPVRLSRTQETLPTYVPYPSDLNPTFHLNRAYQGASGKTWPVPVTDRLRHEKSDVAWDMFTLENEYVRIQMLPQIGGRIHSGLDKTNGYNFIYHNTVIKPALIGLAGPWISGGIEFNWPQHHRPTTFRPVDASTEERPDGTQVVWMGETEPMYGTRAIVGVSVSPGRSWVKAEVRAYNGTPWPQPFMWWANLAVHATEDYRVVFPPDVHRVAFHDRAFIVPWPVFSDPFLKAADGTADQKRDAHGESAVAAAGAAVDAAVNAGMPVDGSWYRNHGPAGSFMVMDGTSRYDFVSGYDEKRRSGTVHVADHRVSSGKKLFTWGNSPYSEAWRENLTDADGPYIELMTGVYTDNQPDFSWMQPHETRVFEQVWYPIREIGLVKNATIDAAMSFEVSDGQVRAGWHATGRFDGARARILGGETVLVESAPGIDPASPILLNVVIPRDAIATELRGELLDADGRVLVSWQPSELDNRDEWQPSEAGNQDEGQPSEAELPASDRSANAGAMDFIPESTRPWTTVAHLPSPEPRTPSPEPKDVASLEELWLHGLHIEQYRQHSFRAEDYWEEALRRDPADIRCNLALGRALLKRGLAPEAEVRLRKALERLMSRNTNPSDGEPLYMLGMALRAQGRETEADACFAKAAWNAAWKSVSSYRLAESVIGRTVVPAAKGMEQLRMGQEQKAAIPAEKAAVQAEKEQGVESGSRFGPGSARERVGLLEALRLLETVLEGNVRDLAARDLKAVVLRRLGRMQEAISWNTDTLRMDPLSPVTRIETLFCATGRLNADCTEASEVTAITRGDGDTHVEAAFFYLGAGLFEEATVTLDLHLQHAREGAEWPMALYLKAWILHRSSPDLCLHVGERHLLACPMPGTGGGFSTLADLFAGVGPSVLQPEVIDSLPDTRREILRLLVRAEKADFNAFFPNRLEEIPVLRFACDPQAAGHMAPYCLGNLLYDKERRDEAMEMWNLSIRRNAKFPRAHRNLAHARFHHENSRVGAALMMKQAFMAAPQDARLLYELQQVMRNNGRHAPVERLSLLDQHPELVQQRSDCTVERITLLLMLGRVREAKEALLAGEFDTYEGGEGKLARVHEWTCLLDAFSRLGGRDGEEASALEALQVVKEAFVLPARFHEGRSRFNPVNHLNWFAGNIAMTAGQTEAAMQYFAAALEMPVRKSEALFYRGLALRRLGDEAEAERCFLELISEGERLIAHGGKPDWFGTGMPTAAPFEISRERRNEAEGNYLLALGLYGNGREKSGLICLQQVFEHDPNHLGAWLHAGKTGYRVLA